MTPLPVRTERLLLRAARPEDAAGMLPFYGDPAVARYVPFEAMDASAVQVRLARYLLGTDPVEAGEALHSMVELDGVLVGDVMLRLTAAPLQQGPPSMAEIGWIFHPSYAGRGLATEAARAVVGLGFDHYGLHRISAQLDPRNTASARLCERLGMTHEAMLRRDWWGKGEWTDTAIYGLLREEWPAT